MPHSVCACDDQVASDSDEKAVLDDSSACAEFGGKVNGIGDGPKVAVEDQVARVGNVLRVVGVFASHRTRAQRLKVAQLRPPAERAHFNRKNVQRPQAVRQLAVVHHDDLAIGGLRDNLLMKERTASALDQVELRINLVGAIDGDIDLQRK